MKMRRPVWTPLAQRVEGVWIVTATASSGDRVWRERVGLNADPDTIKCIRCGDPFATHTRAGTPAAERLLDSRPARRFLVAHSRVFVRSKRSTTGDAIGAIKQGTEISGCTEGRWLHLSRESAQAVNAMPKNKSDTRYVDAWVPGRIVAIPMFSFCLFGSFWCFRLSNCLS